MTDSIVQVRWACYAFVIGMVQTRTASCKPTKRMSGIENKGLRWHQSSPHLIQSRKGAGRRRCVTSPEGQVAQVGELADATAPAAAEVRNASRDHHIARRPAPFPRSLLKSEIIVQYQRASDSRTK